jgi:general secretion pathway protein J
MNAIHVIPRPLPRRAFTLVELVVGIVIAALLAAAAATAISQLVRARTAAVAHRQAFSRASDAAARIALDLAGVTRDLNLANSKVQVTTFGPPNAARDELLLLVRSSRPVRGLSEITGAAEGSDQEVQYRIKDDAGKPTLWRRTDVALDGIVDGGGIASPIIAGVSTLSLEVFDGSAWKESWDSDSDGLPYAVRVVVTASSDDASISATARRVVAIDRVPLPPREEESSDSGTPTDSSGSSSGTGGSQQ